VAWETLTIDNLQVVIQVAAMVQLLGMAHWDIPSWHQVMHNPGSTGCPKRFQFREIIRTLPRSPATFDFLGFTCYWVRSRRGRWGMCCKTKRASLRRAKEALYDWCRRHRHRPVKAQHAALSQ